MNLKELIKEELKKVLKELSVDEPTGGPFGKVLFSPGRKDKVDKREPNTAIERQFEDAFLDHQESSENGALSRLFPKLLKLAKSGKYKKLLQPAPNTYVYRIISNIPVELAAKRLGFSKEELLSDAGQAWYVDLKGALYKSRALVQSWTAYPSVKTFSKLDLKTTRDDHVVILLEANTSDNDFLINPLLPKIVKSFDKFSNEYETVIRNPVKLSGAAFYVVPGKNREFEKKLEKQFFDLVKKNREALVGAANRPSLLFPIHQAAAKAGYEVELTVPDKFNKNAHIYFYPLRKDVGIAKLIGLLIDAANVKKFAKEPK